MRYSDATYSHPAFLIFTNRPSIKRPTKNRPVGRAVNEFVSGVVGIIFKYRNGIIGHCCQRLATAKTCPQQEQYCQHAQWRGDANPQTRYKLWRNTASTMKDLIHLIWTKQISRPMDQNSIAQLWIYHKLPRMVISVAGGCWTDGPGWWEYRRRENANHKPPS